ncbi:MAG: NlpC/P60 family protein [Anaerovoracaceae bacterium]
MLVVNISVGIFAFQVYKPYALTTSGEMVEKPYQITVGDKETILVANKKDGEKIINDLKESFVTPGAKVKKIEIQPEIKIEEKELEGGLQKKRVVSAKEGVDKLVAETQKEDSFLKVTAYEIVEDIQKTPFKVIYKQTSKLDEGEEDVEKKGKDGEVAITLDCVRINGKVVEEKTIEKKVITAPVKKVVAVGISRTPGGDYIITKGVTVEGEGKGVKIAKYALNFIGNPYKYGGTSLTEGADCSGFIQSLYKHFGISLPRTSYDQAKVGINVPLDKLKTGDIIHYPNHVALYIGNGMVVHAAEPGVGIIVSNMYYKKPTGARRVLR